MNAANEATHASDDADLMSWEDVADSGLQPAPADAGDVE